MGTLQAPTQHTADRSPPGLLNGSYGARKAAEVWEVLLEKRETEAPLTGLTQAHKPKKKEWRNRAIKVKSTDSFGPSSHLPAV